MVISQLARPRTKLLPFKEPPKTLSQWSFSYDGSTVGFENDRVTSWYSSSRSPLKVRIVPARDTPNKGYFTVGSTKDEVVAIKEHLKRFHSGVSVMMGLLLISRMIALSAGIAVPIIH